MLQQNICSSPKPRNSNLNSRCLEQKMQQMMYLLSVDQADKTSFQMQLREYEHQFIHCSTRKQNLIQQLNELNKYVLQKEINCHNMNHFNSQEKYFQNLEHHRYQKIPTNQSIKMNYQGNCIQDSVVREALVEKKGGFAKACDEKSLGFIPCTFMSEISNQNERNQSMENLSLKLIPESPRVVQNLIIYRAS